MIQINKDEEYYSIPDDVRPSTFGGEGYYKDDFAEYGLDFGVISIFGITPSKFKMLAIEMINHLSLNGHDFEFYHEPGAGTFIREKG